MSQVTLTNEEYIFDGSTIISQADLEGNITYTNRKFSEVSGYDKNELLNKPLSIIGHPDMPKAIFEKMWDSISTGHTWNGTLKNLRKDGSYYWVDIEILPIKNDNDDVTGYISSSRAPSRKNIEDAQDMFSQMNKNGEV